MLLLVLVAVLERRTICRSMSRRPAECRLSAGRAWPGFVSAVSCYAALMHKAILATCLRTAYLLSPSAFGTKELTHNDQCHATRPTAWLNNSFTLLLCPALAFSSPYMPDNGLMQLHADTIKSAKPIRGPLQHGSCL